MEENVKKENEQSKGKYPFNLVDTANESLKQYGKEIQVVEHADEPGIYCIDVLDIDEDGNITGIDTYADNYDIDQLPELVNEAWVHVLVKVKAGNPKVWLVKQESNVDGQMLFNVVPCKSLEKAKQVMQEEIDTLLKESHFKDYEEWPGDFKIEQTDTSYFIQDTVDDYYEDIQIEEKEIL